MDSFTSDFVDNVGHQISAYPVFPTPPDIHFGFHTLESTNTFINGPSESVQIDSWFCQKWLDNSRNVQTEAVTSSVDCKESTAAACSEHGIQILARPARDHNSNTRSKVQQDRKSHSMQTTTITKQGYSEQDGQNRDSMQDKASRIRERNRNIARKYRGRKQCEAEALEAYTQKLQGENAILRARCNGLANEVLDLKSLLLQHSECNCTMIQAFIAVEAKRSLHSLLSPNSYS
ncbi:uncharacterized protein FPRO_07194 [Fusarium proliferatum ET1]|uniref:BZIP domain-containing protein n=1 Tax=Fusarium proliferatum (strain ET1) TaxID=1227346 RepID=A0A1L7VDT5_FUSPR|nr:uncharacterized protein FPRO_07194 [Fusarium proliferatum ET1]CZR37615.1 uncharacterized protein FPRO_07194 [Fusarium proliferatum ET1]